VEEPRAQPRFRGSVALSLAVDQRSKAEKDERGNRYQLEPRGAVRSLRADGLIKQRSPRNWNVSTSDSARAAFHPRHQANQLFAHQRRTRVRAAAVTRQHPLELIVDQALHRPGLLGPRVPADAG
jgi:hypothetical protein